MENGHARKQEAESKGLYLYAVVPQRPLPDLGEGVQSGHVYTVDEDGLKVVVSDVAMPKEKELRPERKNIAAHQGVLTRLLQSSGALLPFSFGTVADGTDGVKKLVEGHKDELAQQMKRLEGKVEMSLRLVYSAEGPNVFEFLLGQNPDLKSRRDALFSGGRSPSREEKIDFGQALEGALQATRDEFAGRLEGVLSGRVAEFKRLEPRNEREVLRYACLVDKATGAAFDPILQEVAKAFDDRFALEHAGPNPPYDFTTLHLQDEGDADRG